MRILVVDDDITIRQYLSAMLEKWGFDVAQAEDGREAWDILQREPINFILSDWMMPQMDGVELCRRLRAADLPYYVYLILFTGKDQSDDLITALEAGADDFLTKPVDSKELRVRIKAGRRVLSLEEALHAKNRELRQANEELEASQQRTRRDLQAAARIQQDLLPRSGDTGLPVKLAWDLLPADELAGDIFNFFPLGPQQLGFYLIDVSGHGVPAAMLSVHLAKTLSAEPRPDSLVRLPGPESAPQTTGGGGLLGGLGLRKRTRNAAPTKTYRDPVEVVSRLNEHFQTNESSMVYFTMIYGVLDTVSGAGSLCQAGHPYPLICRRDGAIETLGEGGFPVGLVEDADYQAAPFQLAPGDRLLIYSDGITECFGADNEQFGEQRLGACLQASRLSSLQESIEQIKRSLRDWQQPVQGGAGFSDDISLLAIERDEG